MLVLLLAACAGPPASGELLALTYNVAGLPQGISGSEPEEYIPQISPLLDGYDLVLVQEDFAYHDALAADASHPYQSEPKENETDRPMADGLNRFSQSPFSGHVRRQWVACHGISDSASDCLAEKGFASARHELAEGVQVDVVNHHAEAGGGEEDAAARADGYAQLADHLGADGALIVAGDTNLKPDQSDGDAEVLDGFLQATGLADACRTLSCGEEHIDRFLFRSGDTVQLEPIEWYVATEFVTADGQDLSDHPAIAVRFAWSERR